MRTSTAIIGAVIALGGIWLLARGAGPGGLYLEAGPYYTVIYTGPKKTFKAALGNCYDVIYTIDVYDPDTDDWIPPADPQHDFIFPGTIARIKVQAPCTIYNFEVIINV